MLFQRLRLTVPAQKRCRAVALNIIILTDVIAIRMVRMHESQQEQKNMSPL